MRLTLNGESVTCAASDARLIDVLRANGLAPPALCDDARLTPAGKCRLCLVEIAGEPHPVPSCTWVAREGMEVRTDSEVLMHFRATMLGWMAAKISPAAMARFPDKALHRVMREATMPATGSDAPDSACDLSHPLIRVDMSQCIDCFRCVRICEELQGQSVWHAVNRGDQLKFVPDGGGTLGTSSCVACGACVDTCPTAALTDAREPPGLEAATWTRTVCAYCGVGCEIDAASDGERVLAVRPAPDSPVNKGHLCVKGRYAFDFTQAKDRQLYPMLRDVDGWCRTDWPTAIGHVAEVFRRIIDTHGPDAIGVLGSARATNEDNYVIQKFARVVLGTNNVDSCARVCHTPTAAAMKTMLGAGAATNAFDDIEKARAFLVVGANPNECHPVVGARIRQQVDRGGARLVVVDPRRTELAAIAEIHLALRPGTNIAMLNGLAHAIIAEGLIDTDFLRSRVVAFDAFRDFVADWTPERAAAICGVPANDIRAAARLYATTGPAMCFHGLGVTEHSQGTEGVMALINLALLTGNLGKPGCGINPLRGQNNVQGGAHMGCDPSILTGSVAIPEGKALFEREWRAPVPASHGMNLLEMVDAAAAGTLRALWVVGYDVFLSLANAQSTQRALERLELVVVQDLVLNETAHAVGHVFLPAASSFEKDGTFMNSERRVQRVRRVTRPRGEAQTDWRIVCDVAIAMGHSAGFTFGSAEEIWDEIRRVWPDGAGISYDRIAAGGLQWPCRDENDPGTVYLHGARFGRAPTAALKCISYRPTEETTTAAYPFLLTTGRNLYQFNAGTMTARSAAHQLRPTDTLDIAPADAVRLGLVEGELVRVRSRWGEAVLPARPTPAIKPGELFATFHDPGRFLNRLTSTHRDSIVMAPEYKVTAVAIERATGG